MGGTMNTHRICCRILVLAAVVLAVISQGIFAQDKKGLELFNAWQTQEAEKVFREALKANPLDTASNFYLGLCLLLEDRHSDALEVFLKVKSSQDKADQRTRSAIPTEFQIQLALARTRIELKQFSEAWKNLESARIVDGNSSDVYVYRGAYYVHQNKNAEALKELAKAIKLDKKNPYIYYYQGLAYYHSGEAQKAVDALKMFLSLAPDAPEAGEAKQIVTKLC
jgi:tetratricopeptide (TPR) repeat protein